jgi:hypothetical protein
MTKLKAMPINKAVLEYMIQNTVYLASHSVESGHRIDIPYWLPVWDNYAHHSDRSQLTNTLFKAANIASERLPDLEMLLGWDMDAAGAYPADSYGSLGNKLFQEFNDSLAYLKATFQHNSVEKLNFLHQNNAVLVKMIEWGILDQEMLDFTAFSARMNKEVKVLNRHEYYANTPGYLGVPSPVIASVLKSQTGVATSIMQLPDSTGGDGTKYYLKDIDSYYEGFSAYGADPSTLISELEATYRMPYGAILLDADQVSAFLLSGKLPDMGADVAGASAVYVTANLDIEEGALEDDPETRATDWVEHVGFLPKLDNLARMFGGAYVYEDEPGDYFSMLSQAAGNIAVSMSAIYNGILQPFYVCTPVKDPMDPYFFGSFPILTKEEATQPGSWTKWLKNGVTGMTFAEIAAGNAIGSDAYAANSNLLDEDIASPLRDAFDIIGPFVGDAFDLQPDEMLNRPYLATMDIYPNDKPIVYKLPVRPFVNNKSSLGTFIEPAESGLSASIPGVTYGNETAAVALASVDDTAQASFPVSQSLRARRDYEADLVNVIGRTPTRCVESVYKLLSSLIDSFGGNAFSDIIRKFAPVPSASSVSIELSLQQYLDIRVNGMEKGGASMKPFAERTFSNRKDKYSQKREAKPPKRKRRSRRKPKAPFTDKAEMPMSDVKDEPTFGDKTTPDSVDFSKTDSDSKA